jgi:hypothetical protein
MTARWLPLLVLPVLACSSSTKASTGRTERETDSVIGQSQLPGAPVVKKALDASDSSRTRIAKQDSIGTAP